MTTLQIVTTAICVIAAIVIYAIAYGTGYREATEKAMHIFEKLLDMINVTVDYVDVDDE